MNYLIVGNSFNLINDEIKKIIGSSKPDTYSLSDVSLESVLDDLSYNSMFQEEKVIILKNLEVLNKKENENAIKRLEDYLGSKNEGITLILVSNEKVGVRSPLKGMLNKVKVIETPIITKAFELAKILEGKIKADGFGISSQTLNNFASKCAINYDIALSEYEKLKSIKGNNRLITDKDIEEYVANYNMTDMFGFKDAVINKNISKAVVMLDDLESAKMEPIALVVMLAKEYQLVYNIKLMSNAKMTNEAIGKELDNMHPFRVKVLREAGSKYTIEELEKIILELCNMDLRMVSEDNLGYDEVRKFLIQL